MVTEAPRDLPKVLQLQLEISQYPILAGRIREHMREELFARTVLTRETLEAEVREKAIQSQVREGLTDPLNEEPPDVWDLRRSQIRDYLTDFYFAYNLPHDLFREIVVSLVGSRAGGGEVILSFNPEMAPWEILFAQAEQYDKLPADQRVRVQHHLKEIIVVLIKAMISDQLPFVGLAKDHFSIADLREIRRRRIGRGKIGGKAAGMLLAWKILQGQTECEDAGLSGSVVIPDSYYVGADAFYDYHSLNKLTRFLNQKYLPRDEIESSYPRIRELFEQARFPDDVLDELRRLLASLGQVPLIVRSSSLLEDSFGTSFAGKYESYFCANQASPEENLAALTTAISRIYASVVCPSALIYRQKMGLVDYDERMAILIQVVQGERHGDLFFPDLAGVAFSHNPFRWNPRIRREDGFVRLVCGLGTRAVDRVGADYPRMVALSHPTLRPEVEVDQIRQYSQKSMDVIHLERNALVTFPFEEALDDRYPALSVLAEADKGGYLAPIRPVGDESSPGDWVLTLNGVLTRTPFVPMMKSLLGTLEGYYQRPVDLEFTADVLPGHPDPQIRLHLLQCRPQASSAEQEVLRVPKDVPPDRVVFASSRLVPTGRVSGVRYVVYVYGSAYADLPTEGRKAEAARVVGRLNARLEGETFILIGPGRWGSANIDLGVRVSYADIHNTRMLIEVASPLHGQTPEVSFGTHFFQDLVEARIYPLALFPGQPGAVFDEEWILSAPNALVGLLPNDAHWADVVRVVDVPARTGGLYLQVVMDGERDEALGYLARNGGARDKSSELA